LGTLITAQMAKIVQIGLKVFPESCPPQNILQKTLFRDNCV